MYTEKNLQEKIKKIKKATKKGKIIILTMETYEDYNLLGAFLILKTFDIEKEKNIFINECTDKYNITPSNFFKFLLNKKIIKFANYKEIWLGEFHDLNFEITNLNEENAKCYI